MNIIIKSNKAVKCNIPQAFQIIPQIPRSNLNTIYASACNLPQNKATYSHPTLENWSHNYRASNGIIGLLNRILWLDDIGLLELEHSIYQLDDIYKITELQTEKPADTGFIRLFFQHKFVLAALRKLYNVKLYTLH